jgi:hypothetical protein
MKRPIRAALFTLTLTVSMFAPVAQVPAAVLADTQRFGVTCEDGSHTAPVDPIIAFGEPNGSHLHQFIGNNSTDENSTLDSLRAGTTDCHTDGDLSAYWIPVLSIDGAQEDPVNIIVYYRLGKGRTPGVDLVEAPPAGLQMISGNSMAQGPQPVGVVHWKCGAQGTERVANPNLLDCPADGNGPLFSNVFFQTCWDGDSTEWDGGDHLRRHDQVTGDCPPAFPIMLPEIHIQTRYSWEGIGAEHTFTLSSLDSKWTLHGDFFNAWDDARIAELVAECLNTPRAEPCPNDPD